jgi:aquaporin NIP
MNKLFAEFLGTFTLVFAGTGAMVINHISGGVIGHAGVALTFGLVVLALINTYGDVSGAHFNPAVTTAFAFTGSFAWSDVPRYITAQTLGAISASVVLRILFPTEDTLGATLPAGPWWQSFVLEVLLTFFLMITILSISTGSREKGITAGITIGALIGLEAMFAGPICGASMNPARSLGPALVSGHLEYLWVYLIAPVLGSCLAVPASNYVRPEDPTSSIAELPS